MGLERESIPPERRVSEPEWVAHESQAYKQAEDQADKKDLNGETVEVYRITQISGEAKGLGAILREDRW